MAFRIFWLFGHALQISPHLWFFALIYDLDFVPCFLAIWYVTSVHSVNSVNSVNSLLRNAASSLMIFLQTWDLSKNLHDPIFRPKVLHTKSLVNLVVLRKFCEKSCCSPGKITQFAQILHDAGRDKSQLCIFELDTWLRGVIWVVFQLSRGGSREPEVIFPLSTGRCSG